MQINFSNSQEVKLRRVNGHYKLFATIYRDLDKSKKGVIDFIYDSGAFLTVINKERYETLGLNSLPRIEHYINGYTGKADGFYFQLPLLCIAGEDLPHVWAFSPKSSELSQNLLGTNVIEKFRVFQDNENDSFFFQINNNPRYYRTSKGSSFEGGVPFTRNSINSLFTD